MILPLLLMLASPSALLAPMPDRIEKIMAQRDGKTQATAYKVKSVADEYEILRRLHLQSSQQSLVSKDGKTYDVLDAVNPANGDKVELWFDISSFFGHEFGF